MPAETIADTGVAATRPGHAIEEHPMKHIAATATSARHSARVRRAIFAAPALAAVALLAACSGGNGDAGADATSTAADGATSAASGAPAAETTAARPSTAEAEGNGVTAKVSPAEDIADGATVTITLTGLDPNYGGYYVGFCGGRAEGSPAPACTGDRTAPGTQAWLSNRGGTQPVPENGEASISLTAKAVGDGVDCRTDTCTLKVFGDHSEGFEDVVDVPVTFAK